MQYESTFNAIDNILRNEAGCSTELDYIEQTSWLLFLKYLDDLEAEREMNAQMAGKDYKRIITGFLRWNQWAAPKKADGSPDDVNLLTGPDLQQFVDNRLFPELRKFQSTAASANTLEYKIGEIFAELRNKITSGYNLREVIDLIDTLHFRSAEDKHEMTLLYEDKIKRMGNAGRNGGEYYTPRPLIKTIVKVVDPKIGETVYDPACGSAGFLCEAFAYMSEKVKGTKDAKTLQEDTFFGKEKKPLPYIIATMNMIFHGVAAPNIIRGNTLAENMSQVQEKDRKDVILANPPFGGSERGEVLQNFDLRTSETAYMFMQHFIKMLKAGGRAGIVIKNTFLSNGDAAALRKVLLEQCNLHTILDLPSGVFQGAGVKTVVLFFGKGTPTKKIWYYQLNPGRNLGKTNALNEDDLADFLKLQKTKADSENSWNIDVSTLGDDRDLSVKNPNKVEEVDERTSREMFESFIVLNNEISVKLEDLRNAIKEAFTPKEGWKYKKLGEIATDMYRGSGIKRDQITESGYPCIRYGEIYTTYNIAFDKCVSHTVEENIRPRKYFEYGDLLFAITGESVEDIGKTIAYLGHEKCLLGGDIVCMKHNEDPKYLAYALSSKEAIRQKGIGKTKLKVVHTNIPSLKEIEIPVPPIEEQRSIVSRLDAAFAGIDALKANAERQLAECDALKQAMLKEVFE